MLFWRKSAKNTKYINLPRYYYLKNRDYAGPTFLQNS